MFRWLGLAGGHLYTPYPLQTPRVILRLCRGHCRHPSVGTCTVFLIRCEGPGYSAEYRSVRKRELINVDLPSPDSPAEKKKKKLRKDVK